MMLDRLVIQTDNPSKLVCIQGPFAKNFENLSPAWPSTGPAQMIPEQPSKRPLAIDRLNRLLLVLDRRIDGPPRQQSCELHSSNCDRYRTRHLAKPEIDL